MSIEMSIRVHHRKPGTVYLIGAGPGDPELLTLKALRCLQRADVIVYDRLVDRRLLQWAPAAAERIDVGKKGGHYAFPQANINALLVQKARERRTVVRLKGGDPFLFGRGGEEALYLMEHAIPFEIVPGISAALAVPSSAGIPVTHRQLSSSLAVVTGHQCSGTDSEVRWDLLARATDTLVVLMPLHNLRAIVSQLVLHGRSLETPAAVIQSGTLEDQQQVISTLRDIASAVAESGIQSPATLIVGEVVDIGRRLAPFLKLGARPEDQSSEPARMRRSV